MKTRRVRVAVTALACMMLLSMFTACGTQGEPGVPGKDGKSAYELAVENGYDGTVEEWLASLVGEVGATGADGKDGKSAYEIAVEKGFAGTEEEWLTSLLGEQGQNGAQGKGIASAYVNEERHLILVLTDGTETDAGYVGKRYSVTFNWNCDDSSLATTAITVDEGTILEMPTIPERENTIFLGWYLDTECANAFDFTAPIYKNTTIYAGWREETYADILEYQSAELEKLKTLNDGTLPEILLNEDTYAPAFILGTYSDDAVTDFDSAVESLKDVENLMGFQNVDGEYEEISSFTFKGTTQYRMQQMYNGYVVYGQQLIVTTDATGKVTSLSGDYATIGTMFDPSVHITVEEAIALAAEYGEYESAEVTLVVYTLDGYNEMAYVLENDLYTVVISANVGTVISIEEQAIMVLPSVTKDDVMTSTIGKDAAGNTFNTSYIDYADSTKQDTYIFYDKVRNIVYHDLESQDIRNVINTWSCLSDDDNVWESDSIDKLIALYSNLTKTYDFYLNVLGLLSYDGNGGEILAYINDGRDSGKNAYSYDLSEYNCTALSFGGIANYQNAIDVVGHEFTHSIQGALSDLQYSGQSGALMEAYSDVMGELVQLYYSHTDVDERTTDWVHGDRNLKNPTSVRDATDDWLQKYPEQFYGTGYYESADVHHNSTVISHAIYTIYESGLNDIEELSELLYRTWGYLTSTATFYDYRMSMLAAAELMGLGDEKITYITNAFDEANIYSSSVPEDYDQGFFTSVRVNWRMVDSRTLEPIPGAQVVIKAVNEDEAVVALAYCDENGECSVRLKAGLYMVTETAAGYGVYTTAHVFEPFTSINMTTKLCKEDYQEDPVACIVGGQITDALTGENLDGVVMKFRKGYNITSGSVKLSLTTNESGEYFTDALEYGYYTVELSKFGYITSHVIIQAAANWENPDHEHENVLSQNFSISPMVQQGGTMRIVLSWGATPSDLDSHLYGTSTTGSSYHVYYNDKYEYESSTIIAELDIDDTTSYGPETVTVDLQSQGDIIRYCVHDYSTHSGANSTVLASSGATIQVYLDNSLIKTYNVPTTQLGTVWHVFDYDVETGRFTVINEITDSFNR